MLGQGDSLRRPTQISQTIGLGDLGLSRQRTWISGCEHRELIRGVLATAELGERACHKEGGHSAGACRGC